MPGDDKKTVRILFVTGLLCCLLFFSILAGCISNPEPEPSAGDITAKFLENSDNVTVYRLDATIAIFQYPGFHAYHLETYGVRPYLYYLEWSSPGENDTEVFIVNGTTEWDTTYWRVLPAKKEAYYAIPFSMFPGPPMDSYDILWFVTDRARNYQGSMIRNATLDDDTTCGIEYFAPEYAGMKDCTVVLAIDRNTSLPRRMMVYGSTGSLQQDLTFHDLDTDLSIPAGFFDYTPPEDFQATSDIFRRPFPLDPLYYAALNIGRQEKPGGPLTPTPATLAVPGEETKNSFMTTPETSSASYRPG
jgi:outer membrane lipoprotein-sorting protein